MEVIDTQKARGILEDLRLQLKEAHERFVLLTGATQGAESIINALSSETSPEAISAVQGAEAILAVSVEEEEEEAAVEPNPPMTPVKKTRGKK